MEIDTTPESVGLSSKRLALIRPWMQQFIDTGRLPGAATLVARHGQVVFCEARGLKNIETCTSLTMDTIHRFYSMTKPVTSVAAMMLYEKGLFQLDDPVSDFIPGFKDMKVYVSGSEKDPVTRPAKTAMTIRHLLTHTSGFTYGSFNTGTVAGLYRQNRTDFDYDDGPLEKIVNRLTDIPLEFDPGSAWNYGVSTDVLGRLIEIWSGRSLDRFLNEEIFKPLTMIDTGFFLPESKKERLASLYELTDKELLSLSEDARTSPLIGTDSVQTFSGGSGLLSTMSDFYKFTEMLRQKGQLSGERLLGRKTIEFMTCNHLPGDLAAMGQPTFNETTFEGIGFGLGFSVMLDPPKANIMGSCGEYAWGGAASTAFWIDPLEDITVIFLTQLMPSSAYTIRRELRVLTYQAIID